MTLAKNVTFAVGFGTSQCIYIPILNDNRLEDFTEDFYVILSATEDCVIINENANISIVIQDDDSKPASNFLFSKPAFIVL